jgi:hypothetical protein
MASTEKDTIYIDVDDEITGIIDKVKNAKSKVVALVLPKRAAVFQSIVNMKLLKKSVEGSNKNLVLITSEAGLLPLAGAAGIHVAKTLTSKPEIPSPPEEFLDNPDIEQEDVSSLPDESENIDPTQPVGELAASDTPKSNINKDDLETVALDNTVADEAEDDVKDKAKRGKKTDAKKDKKLKVPNFEKFRKYLIFGAIGLVILIILFFLLGSSFNKATIDITTNASNVNTNLNLNLSTSATSVDTGSSTIPAKVVSEQKTFSAQVGTTGQTNNGNKASGSVTMTAQYCGSIPANGPPSIPAGTGLSSNGQTFLTQQVTTFNSQFGGSHGCANYPATSNTPIIAQNAGTSYNNANNFTVAGYSNVNVSVAQTVMGGTDNIVQTVNQNDINNAKAKISTNSNGVKNDLTNQLNGDGYYPLNATFNTGTPNTTSSSSVGQVADNVTVTETITYSMFGVYKTDLETLVSNNVDGQINTSQQSILNYGLDNAVYNLNTQTANSAQLTMTTIVEVGPQLNITKIEQSVAGQKAAAVKSQLLTNPNVTSVNVKISPFWSSTVPSNTSKITVNIAKPTTTKSNT